MMKYVVMGCLVLMISLGGAVMMASATEEPVFKVIRRVGEIEIRRYVPTVHATVPMEGQRGGFQRLAGFIFGGNQKETSIAMTAPVQIDMTAAQRTMTFIMPAEYSPASLPRPNDPGIVIHEVPEQTVAVVTFSGRVASPMIEDRLNTLVTTLAEAGVGVTQEWSLNQYDPPWIPGPFRRNEIWVRLSEAM